MDERAALGMIEGLVDQAGDDAAVIDDIAIGLDMLHASADFPPGVTRYTAGWRSVAVALSDLAAVGARPVAALCGYGAPSFVPEELESFVAGARDMTAAVDAAYVGGDLDRMDEFTTVGVGLGRVAHPVSRSGANVGDVAVVTGSLGRGALAYHAFDAGEHERGNRLYRFLPRIDAGEKLASAATSMIDSSDGLARSLHLLAEASNVGFAIDRERVPIDDRLDDYVCGSDKTEAGLFWGEDFELVATVPPEELDELCQSLSCPLTQVGTVVEYGLTLDGDPLPDRGYTH